MSRLSLRPALRRYAHSVQRRAPAFVGAYDDVPDIAALYAMRRGLTAYTGPILRLRRSSDNAESDFGYVANGDLDTAAVAAFVGAGSGYITTWYDQSGNANHATQTTAAAQPLYVASGQNGRPVARFDGSDYLDTGYQSLYNNQNRAMIARISNRTGTTRQAVMGGSTPHHNRFAILSRFDGATTLFHNGTFGEDYVPGVISAGVLAVSGATGYIDGVAVASCPPGSGTLTNTITIGCHRYNSTSGLEWFFTGDIHEAIIAPVAYDALQVAAITDVMEAY